MDYPASGRRICFCTEERYYDISQTLLSLIFAALERQADACALRSTCRAARNAYSGSKWALLPNVQRELACFMRTLYAPGMLEVTPDQMQQLYRLSLAAEKAYHVAQFQRAARHWASLEPNPCRQALLSAIPFLRFSSEEDMESATDEKEWNVVLYIPNGIGRNMWDSVEILLQIDHGTDRVTVTHRPAAATEAATARSWQFFFLPGHTDEMKVVAFSKVKDELEISVEALARSIGCSAKSLVTFIMNMVAGMDQWILAYTIFSTQDGSELNRYLMNRVIKPVHW